MYSICRGALLRDDIFADLCLCRVARRVRGDIGLVGSAPQVQMVLVRFATGSMDLFDNLLRIDLER